MKMPLMLHCFPFVACKKTHRRDLPTLGSCGKAGACSTLAVVVLSFAAAFPGPAQVPQPDGSTTPQTSATTQVVPAGTVPVAGTETPFSVVRRDANSRVWQKTVYEATQFGGVRAVNHSYKELASGMHYKNANGDWTESKETIRPLLTGGAAAAEASHQAFFPADIYQGVIELVTPDGLHLKSRPLCVSYFDGTNSVLIAELTNSIAQILPSGNQIIYTNVLTDFACDLVCTFRKSGVENDLVFRASPPAPEVFGLNPDATRIQLLTEFFDTADPTVQTLAANPTDGLADTVLKFGAVKMRPGKAFSVGQRGQADPQGGLRPPSEVPVYKSWLHLDGRVVLVEETMYSRIKPQLDELAAVEGPERWLAAGGGGGAPRMAKNQSQIANPDSSVRQGGKRLRSEAMAGRALAVGNKGGHLAAMASLWLPPARKVKPSTSPVQMAQADLAGKPGVVLDYVIVNGYTSPDPYVFSADATYLISGGAYASQFIIMGGTVIKFPSSGAGSLSPDDIVFQTGPYRMAVLTSADDNSVGETISGSTGSPQTQTNIWNAYLYLTSPSDIEYARFSYAGLGTRANDTVRVRHSQFLHCVTGLYSIKGALYNDLISDCSHAWYDAGGFYTNLAQNVTVANCTNFFWGLSWSTNAALSLTNCLLTGVTNFFQSFYPTVLPQTLTNSSVITSNRDGFFQTAAGGIHYLCVGSTNRLAGTTNIDSTLLAELRTKTTWPPIVYTNASLTNGGTWGPQAQRETTGIDIGYAEDPLDYAFGGCDLNTNLTFAPGTAVGWFRTSSGWYHAGHGIHIADGQTLSFNGTATQPDYWVRCSTAQELDTTGGYGPGGITGWTWPDFSQTPLVSMRFTRCSILAWEANHMRDDNGYLIVHARDCEFWGGGYSGYCSQLNCTNCLFDDVSVWTQWDGVPTTNCTFIFQNCLMHLGGLWPGRSAPDANGNYCLWSIHDSAFDGTALGFSDAAGGTPSWTQFGYNASLNGAGRTSPTNAHDLVVTNFSWVTGPLGNYYQPANSPLINTGSVANAGLVGLYHYSLITNLVNGLEIKETNSVLDIGYHYVAVDSDGLPVSTSCGVPDYLADANGNGVDDPGETPWDLGISSQPQSQNVVQGANVTFSVTATGGPSLSYQWQFNGVDIPGATGTSYTRNNVQPADAGSYSTVVSSSQCSVDSADGNLTVVGVSEVIIDDSNPGNQVPIYACSGSPSILRAVPSPTGIAFPGGFPVWTITSQPAGSSIANPAAGSPTATITPVVLGQYIVQAACGTSSATFTMNCVGQADSDYDGICDCEEISDGTDLADPASVLPVRLGYWRFDNTNTWIGEQGQLPLVATNITGVSSWNTNAVEITAANAVLAYRDVETGSCRANINLRTGTIRFWFKADWTSANAGGTGPQTEARLIEMGNEGTSDGWWGLVIGSAGTNLYFGTQTNSVATLATNVSAPISWSPGAWHQVVLTYSTNVSSLYLDGQPVALTGAGVAYFPGPDIRLRGFTIGSSASGANQAKGAFDGLETFNYMLDTALIQTDYQTAINLDSDGDGWPNILENLLGTDPYNYNSVPQGVTIDHPINGSVISR
jgi:hypothetical protein